MPAKTFGDVNNDGIRDLAFVRNVAGTNVVTVVMGGEQMNIDNAFQAWPRMWDAQFVTNNVNYAGPSSFRTIRLLGASMASPVDVHILKWNPDQFDDVVVLSGTTTGASSIVSGQYDLATLSPAQ